jgi:AcrR family transcriptional regulator
MTSPDLPTIDRRVQRTRTALRDALLKLMTKSGWDDVNVQDICDSANVGRSTFYIHFQSKEALLSFSLDGLCNILSVQPNANTTKKCLGLRFVRGLLEHIDEQRQLSRTIVGRRSSYVVQARFRDMVHQLVDADVSRMAPPGWQREASVHYIAAALWGLLVWWVETAKPVSVDRLEALFLQLAAPTLTYASQQQ